MVVIRCETKVRTQEKVIATEAETRLMMIDRRWERIVR